MKILNGNQIKILACILMTIDHIGYFLFPNEIVLRIIGRLALPLFAYLIAEGCHYTRNKFKHFATIFVFGTICHIGVTIASPKDADYLNVLLTFSLSTLIIYALDKFKKNLFAKNTNSILYGGLFASSILASWFLCQSFEFDYGFFGVLLPVFCSLTYDVPDCKAKKFVDNQYVRLFFLAVGIFLLWTFSKSMKSIEPYAFLSVLILLFYNGERGKWNMKYFFYIFYPAHIAIINLIEMLY